MSRKHSDVLNISSVVRQGGPNSKVGPVLVEFEHGKVYPESFQTFKASLKCKFPDAKSQDGIIPYGTAPKLDVKVKTDGMTYSSKADSIKDIRRPDQYRKTLLAIRKKGCDTFKLVELNSVMVGAQVEPPAVKNPQMLELMRMKEEEENEGEENQKKSPEDLNKSLAKKKRHLVQEFGQAKGKRVYEQADRMQVESEKLQAKLNKAANAVDETAIQFENQEPVTILTPPCKRDAKRVHEVYNLNDILSEYDLDQLSEAVPVFMEEYDTVEKIRAAVKLKQFTELLAVQMEKHVKSGEDSKLMSAMYMEAILKFLGLKSRDLSKGPRALPSFIPLGIRHKVFNTFTTEQRTTPEGRDRGVCYALVLALIINNFSVDFSAVTSSIRCIRVDQLKKLIQVVGASVQSDTLTKKSFVTLRLPLTSFNPNKLFKKKK